VGKYKEYLNREYNTDFAKFVPNYYKLFYKIDKAERICIACKQYIEKETKYVMMYSKGGGGAPILPLCLECGEECAKIHKMEIGR